MKDGTFNWSEHEERGDRVRYYSIERPWKSPKSIEDFDATRPSRKKKSAVKKSWRKRRAIDQKRSW